MNLADGLGPCTVKMAPSTSPLYLKMARCTRAVQIPGELVVLSSLLDGFCSRGRGGGERSAHGINLGILLTSCEKLFNGDGGMSRRREGGESIYLSLPRAPISALVSGVINIEECCTFPQRALRCWFSSMCEGKITGKRGEDCHLSP